MIWALVVLEDMRQQTPVYDPLRAWSPQAFGGQVGPRAEGGKPRLPLLAKLILSTQESRLRSAVDKEKTSKFLEARDMEERSLDLAPQTDLVLRRVGFWLGPARSREGKA